MKLVPLLALLAVSVGAQAQKKPLDHSVYDSWQRASAASLSADGRVLTYEVNPQEGDGTLYFRDNSSRRVISVPRGYRAKIVDGNRYAVCQIKPTFQQTRQAKIKKKKADDMPKDSLAIVDLKTGALTKFACLQSSSIGKYAVEGVAFTVNDTALIPKKDRKKKDIGKPMLVYHFASGVMDTVRNVGSFTMNDQGTAIAYITNHGKRKNLLRVLDVKTAASVVIGDTLQYYSTPRFSDDGTKMLYLQSSDTLDSGSKHCALMEYVVGTQSPRQLIAERQQAGAKDGWGITENGSPSYSQDGRRIFVGVQPYIPPNDTTLYSFETPALDIWVYDAPTLPPADKKNLSRIKKQTCLNTVIGGRLVPLTTSLYDRINLIDRGNAPLALSNDMTGRMVDTQWNTQVPQKVSLVDVETGSRKAVVDGKVAHVTMSPTCNYIAWFDLETSQWILYDVKTGSTRNLTAALGVNFYNEDDDHPALKGPYSGVEWAEGDKYIVVRDRFDLWRLATDGSSATCITRGEGRRQNRTYSYMKFRQREETDYIRASEKMLLNVFDKTTKESGFATTDLKGGLKTLPLEKYSFSGVSKARNAETYTFLKGNFNESNDVYITSNRFASQQKISAINAQQKDYNWGTVELFHWTAFDGKPLEGLLYKPEDFNPEKQYPVIIYFYEKNSDNLYRYSEPTPSASIVNYAFYASRGYLVFVPDIVYTAGTPGESAYNCIVSGAQELARQKWVDEKNMAIQGQSWGGYQVAYLVTRTNMFKAAEAGAPVSNMTSAYGGIRWGSGSSRQNQYEMGQSRIGRSLWEAPELYISNSALFKLQDVQTPLLIMHNDGDGAVPWYQGIELFMGLRRLGKPAWLLEYNNEGHNLTQRRNRKDLSIRMQEFFDYELKGAEEPEWMKSGIPILRKGQYFAY